MVYLQTILQDLFKNRGGREGWQAFSIGSNSAVMAIYLLEVSQTPEKEYRCRVSAVGKYPQGKKCLGRGGVAFTSISTAPSCSF